jgi:hypothetical protein
VSKITAILEPQADGNLHLPVPEEMRHQRIKITAVLEPISSRRETPCFGRYAGQIWISPDFNAAAQDFKDYME